MYLPTGYQDTKHLLRNLKSKNEDYWIKRGEKRVLKLFREMAQRVPAYKDFLKKHKIKAETIKTINDFKKVPTISKDNYLRKYPLEMVCWDGRIKDRSWTICATSGSTGEPFYFPHEKDQDWQYAIVAELYLRTNFQIHKKSTLYIIGFIMGTWLGGVFTFEALRLLTEKGKYKLSIITPGIDKVGIINAVKKLGPHFDQVIIGSYGPFLKDVLDDGVRMGVNWKKYNMGFVFSAEGFSEGMRDYVMNLAGVKNKFTATLNHYGTVDLGTMSYETPLSILLRKRAIDKRAIYKSLFGDTNKLPTFTQYMPDLFYFEEVEGLVICSAYSGIPLVRYDLRDIGGVCSFEKVMSLFNEGGVNVYKEAEEARIVDTIWNLPFVWVFERNDFMVKFYLCDVYPEPVKKALLNLSLTKKVTGKFTMIVKFDRYHNQYLEINVELKAEVKATDGLKKKVAEVITNQLLKENEGYADVYRRIKRRAVPKIVFWPYEHPKHFKPGGKQKWVKKD